MQQKAQDATRPPTVLRVLHIYIYIYIYVLHVAKLQVDGQMHMSHAHVTRTCQMQISDADLTVDQPPCHKHGDRDMWH